MQKQARGNKQRGHRGFVLVTMASAAVVVFGCLGLSVDLGRMYIVKNEAQSYADAAALAAGLKLDGTTSGVTSAQTAATSLGDNWNFATTPYTGTSVQVATSLGGPWVSTITPPNPATNYIYARVTANTTLPLYFLPVVTGVNSTKIQAIATAEQVAPTTWNEGAFPFSPIAFDGPNGGNSVGPNWGFIAGNQYTMRYAADGKSECSGDEADSDHLKNGSSRGFWGDNSASVIGQQVQGDLQEESLTVGQSLPGVGGAKTSVASDMADRVDQDGNYTDDTYASYLANPAHNGRRVVVMPIQSEVDGTVLAFGTFLLMDDGAYGHTGNSNWCAIYIGGATVTDGSGGGSSIPGAYVEKLVQ